jgi:hypothetical protein
MSEEGEVPSEAQTTSLVGKLVQQRKRRFIKSLQQVLVRISEDRIVRQMLQDKASGQFIMKRVEELLGQILREDRELYIEKILKQLRGYESIYSREHAEAIKRLGDRILLISDAQNTGEVQHQRKIRALQEQVQALKSELVAARTAITEETIEVREIQRPTDMLCPDFDPASPTFMHIFAHVDVTELQVKLKLIQADSETSKQLVLVLCERMRKIFTVMNNKSKDLVSAYQKKTLEYRRHAEKQMEKAETVRKEYEEKVIPALKRKHKELSSKWQVELEEQTKEITKLQSVVKERGSEISSLKSRQKEFEKDREEMRKEFEKDREEMQREFERDREQILSAKEEAEQRAADLRAHAVQQEEEVKSSKGVVRKQSDRIEELELDIRKAESDLFERTQENEGLKDSLDEARRQIEVLQREASKVSRLTEENDGLKTKQNALTQELAKNQRQIADLQQKSVELDRKSVV